MNEKFEMYKEFGSYEELKHAWSGQGTIVPIRGSKRARRYLELMQDYRKEAGEEPIKCDELVSMSEMTQFLKEDDAEAIRKVFPPALSGNRKPFTLEEAENIIKNFTPEQWSYLPGRLFILIEPTKDDVLKAALDTACSQCEYHYEGYVLLQNGATQKYASVCTPMRAYYKGKLGSTAWKAKREMWYNLPRKVSGQLDVLRLATVQNGEITEEQVMDYFSLTPSILHGNNPVIRECFVPNDEGRYSISKILDSVRKCFVAADGNIPPTSPLELFPSTGLYSSRELGLMYNIPEYMLSTLRKGNQINYYAFADSVIRYRIEDVRSCISYEDVKTPGTATRSPKMRVSVVSGIGEADEERPDIPGKSSVSEVSVVGPAAYPAASIESGGFTLEDAVDRLTGDSIANPDGYSPKLYNFRFLAKYLLDGRPARRKREVSREAFNRLLSENYGRMKKNDMEHLILENAGEAQFFSKENAMRMLAQEKDLNEAQAKWLQEKSSTVIKRLVKDGQLPFLLRGDPPRLAKSFLLEDLRNSRDIMDLVSDAERVN